MGLIEKILSMRAVDHKGLGQFTPKGSTRSIRRCHILYGFRRFFFHNTCSYIDPRGVVISDPRGLVGRIYVGNYLTLLYIKYISCGPNGLRRRFSKFFASYKSMGHYRMILYMEFHHIWLTAISNILLSKCKRMMSDARPLPY